MTRWGYAFVALTCCCLANANNATADVGCALGNSDSSCSTGGGVFENDGLQFLSGLCLSKDGCAVGGCSAEGCGQQTDCGFDDFISPMINFVFFEDPRNITEIRPIFVSHQIPDALGGGSAQLYALQFRIALTDRLSVIAVKDGFIVDKTGGAVDTLLGDGWADVSAGLKYNFLKDPNSGTLASVGFTYEMPIGSSRALQKIGDGEFHFFITGGKRLADGKAHLLSSLGYRLPVDSDIQTTSIHWSNHIDYKLNDKTYIFTECAWWHWTDSASGGAPLGIAGQDLFNLPSSNVSGNDLLTQSVGLKFKPRRNTEIGIAYEFPLTSFEDLIKDRVMVDFILRF